MAAVLVLIASFAGAFAADEQLQAARERLESIRAQFEYFEAEVAKTDQPARALAALREKITPLRAELREVIAALEPRLIQAQTRLKQLGAPPAASATPEAPAIAAEREEQSALAREIDAALRQARLYVVQSDQLLERIDGLRRTAFTGRLFARAASVFNPDLWLEAAAAIPVEIDGLQELLLGWRDHLFARVSAGSGALAILLVVLAVLVVIAARTIVHRYFGRWPPEPEKRLLARHQKAPLAFRDAIVGSLAAPAASLAVFEILSAFELLPDRIGAIAFGIVKAIIFVAIGLALARAVLSPGDATRRLPAIDDRIAARLFWLVANAIFVTAIAVLVNVVHRTLGAPLAATIATNALYALLIAALIVYALLVRTEPSDEHDERQGPGWLRLLGWIAVATIFVSLAAGYVRFASFVSERLVTASVVVLGLYLLLALVDHFFGQGLSEDSPRRRSIAATFGVGIRTLDLAATLFAGLLRALLVVVAIFMVIGTLTASVIDIGGAFDVGALSINIGRIEIELADILGAVTILLAGLIVTRILHRWLARSVLPRTQIEASLQNSIATIFGYAGVIIALSLGLARLGVNLENIALIAGALSVGIGFGLQAIVSNFVSGLILLTERPIRVGDWIVVGSEEGYVRKISVRSTEIETFDRASVIVPNSNLITQTVKNWTHADYLGRLAVPVGVAYDSDPEKVREVLLAAAAAHPEILDEPAPYVLFMKFGDSALEFELRGVVANVNQRLTVSSDLHFDIFRRLREAGIEIPFPQRDIHIRSAPSGASEGAAPASPSKRG